MPQFLLHQLRQGHTENANCALCGLEEVQVRRYLEGVGNDGVNNIPLRQRLARLGGYCPAHCEQFSRLTHLLSVAILLEDFVKARLERARAGKRPIPIRCEACDVALKARAAFQDAVRRHRRTDLLHETLLAMPLCLTHLEIVCRFVPPEVRVQLVARHDALLKDLAEVVRKHDYRFTHEPMSPQETGSVPAALRLLGAPPRREE
jgi:hypothetical protein